MTTRKDRLRKLAEVQEQLTAVHEMRLAGYRARAAQAEEEARTLRERFDTEGSMSALFPEVYHRRIERALQRAARNDGLAQAEVAKVAAATARTNMAERAYREARSEEERIEADRERLDAILRGLPARRE